LLAACRADGIHTAVETALQVPFEAVETVLPVTDLFLADCKIPDPEKHRRYTGQDNRRILANLARLAETAPGRVTVRIPLIPGVNDRKEDIAGFAQVLTPLAESLRGIEVLRYNNLAASKYTAVGWGYTDFGDPQTIEEAKAFCVALETALEGRVPVYTDG
jgi:pyruvate formate lyase activating enzyme